MINQIIIDELSLLPISHNGNKNVVIDVLHNLKINYIGYKEYIDEYFIKYKHKYFTDISYNYSLTPIDCRSNSYLETYNKYIKNNLENKKDIPCLNFITFVKNESLRIEKTNIKIKSKKSKFKENKYIEKILTDQNNTKNNLTGYYNPFIQPKIESHKTNI